MIEEGPREQRNQLFSVLGSLTDPEEEESKDSSEVNSMRSLLFDVGVLCLSLADDFFWLIACRDR